MRIGQQLGVIGVGNMGAALVRGWLASGLVEPGDLLVADADNRRLQEVAKEFGLPVDTNRGVARRAGILLLAVKPHILPAVLADIKPE
ncbi:MAG: pyrroline-5-carboxylate reductase family protein, partial [Desulfobacca sp.]|uniref:pyrroline-5-carboxylate reductase family protein n=1 Tax=Desulfobacca sp. TaxID=2067990 RepID=UPI00404A3CC3